MSRKGYTAEQIISMLREAEVAMVQGRRRMYGKEGKLLKNSRQCRNRPGAPKIFTSIIISARAFAYLYT